MEDQKFYIGVKAFIKKDDTVLVLFDKSNGVRFPGGKIQEGEDYITALKREVKEETSLEISVREPFTTWLHIKQMNGLPIFLIGYMCEYVSGDVVLNEEHERFKWVSAQDMDILNDGSVFFEQLPKYFSKQ
jgi:8-oxo-dGTP diphosphatase